MAGELSCVPDASSHSRRQRQISLRHIYRSRHIHADAVRKSTMVLNAGLPARLR